MTASSSYRVALVTGASSGIGRAVALALAEQGLAVGLCARRIERLETLAGEIVANGGRAHGIACDMRDTDQIARAVAEVEAHLGPIDVLVNNAGLGRDAPLLEGPVEAWREMLEVNVLGLSACTLEVVRRMRDRGDDGYVFHVSSMAAHRVPPGAGMYSASKYAVRALTEGLRRELRDAGSKIRVTAISPGFVETEFAQVYAGRPEAAAETYGRFPCLQPGDIADLVVYALTRPPHVQLHDVLLRPTDQET